MENKTDSLSIFDYNPTPEELKRLRLKNISQDQYFKLTNPKARLIDLSMLFLFRNDIPNSMKYIDLALEPAIRKTAN